MLALIGGSAITPLTSLDVPQSVDVQLDPARGLVFAPIMTRIMWTIAREMEALSADLGLAQGRFLTWTDAPHERIALEQAAEVYRASDLRGVYQIAEKRRSENHFDFPFRLPVFVMWEAFTYHDSDSGWIAVAAGVRTWLEETLRWTVQPARSLNTLVPDQPAQEYVLLDDDGDQAYVTGSSGVLTNVELLPDGLPPHRESGYELGNSYSLEQEKGAFRAAHSVGLDRLAGALLIHRPRNLLDWRHGPITIHHTIVTEALGEGQMAHLAKSPDLTVAATGADIPYLVDELSSRGLPTQPDHLLPFDHHHADG